MSAVQILKYFVQDVQWESSQRHVETYATGSYVISFGMRMYTVYLIISVTLLDGQLKNREDWRVEDDKASFAVVIQIHGICVIHPWRNFHQQIALQHCTASLFTIILFGFSIFSLIFRLTLGLLLYLSEFVSTSRYLTSFAFSFRLQYL